MCGIAGALWAAPELAPRAEAGVRLMSERMRARGPDAEGFWSAGGVALGHRRLSILDLDARADQPMLSADGRYALVFNGEIYNFRELRRELAAAGAALRTSSDTEVLLELFAREGAAMLPRLRGMFAFALWDARERELFLARDPYGIKPLYYARTETAWVFASQVKALLASGLVTARPEPAGLAGFYLWGSVPEPWTLYRDVLSLPAGHWLRVRAGAADAPVCWRDVRDSWRVPAQPATEDERRVRVRTEVAESVRAHLVSDVPVAVFLSGGVDSAAIAALAAESGAVVEGITIGFDEFAGRPEDEVPAAAAVASRFGLRHRVRRVSRAEFEQDRPRIMDAMDQPSVDGVNTWFAAKAAAENGFKAALSGVGGDELFGGYSSFRRLPQAAALGRAVAFVPGARALLRGAWRRLARRRGRPKYAAVPEYAHTLEGAYFLYRGLFMPEELPALMGVDAAQEGLARLGGAPAGMTRAGARDPFSGVGLLESTLYLRNQLLRDADWASMAHSLELRTPLADAALLTALGPLVSGFRGGRGKRALAASPAATLPEAVAARAKTGFSLPMRRWLSGGDDISWARSWARIVAAEAAACA
jgi:asparagine synthase (glutamine-hydrolysing)